tara:strand:+ start:243 stop:1379 length:1137 start_codon:yes stop_codon:yes gene_type:complete
VWDPSWDKFAAGEDFRPGTGEDNPDNSRYVSPDGLDFSRLAGYRVDNTRGPGNAAFAQLLDPSGKQLDLQQYEQSGSWKSKDYIEMAAVAAAMFGGGMMLNGGLSGLGASSSLATGTGVGGATGLETSMAALNAMALPEVPAAIGAGAGAGAGTAATAGAVTYPVASSGYGSVAAAPGASTGWAATLDPLATTAAGTGGSTGWAAALDPLTGSLSSTTATGSGSWLSQLGQSASSFLGSGSGARSAFDIVSGLYGLKLAGDARKASDPFGQYRGAYGAQLAGLEANPSTITGRPGWQAGMEAIQRNNAARGYAGSGNEMAIMSRYGGEFFNNEATRLAGLAGAGAAPGAGQFNAAQLTGQGLASIGYGLAPYLQGGPR